MTCRKSLNDTQPIYIKYRHNNENNKEDFKKQLTILLILWFSVSYISI